MYQRKWANHKQRGMLEFNDLYCSDILLLFAVVTAICKFLYYATDILSNRTATLILHIQSYLII